MIKALALTQEGKTLRIEGYPDAIAFKRIEGKHAVRLRAMTLHDADLTRCWEALQALASDDNAKDSILRDCLWIAAVALYFKCFGNSKARCQLDAKAVFKTQSSAMPAFQYFDALRNKHILHDENAYTQSFVGIVVNPVSNRYKVADVVSSGVDAITSDPSHVKSLSTLVNATRVWVAAERDRLHKMLADEYEAKPYEVLLAMPNVQIKVPTASQVKDIRADAQG